MGPRLPNEVVLSILDSLPSNDPATRETLRSCRIASRGLASFTTPVLFRNFYLRGGLRTSLTAMEGMIKSNLVGYVRHITVSASACILEKFLHRHNITGDYILDPGVSKVLQSLEQFLYQAGLWADEFALVWSKFLDACCAGHAKDGSRGRIQKVTLEVDKFHLSPTLQMFMNSVGGGFGHLDIEDAIPFSLTGKQWKGWELEARMGVLQDMRHLSNPTSLSKITSLTVDCSSSTQGSSNPSLEGFCRAILHNIERLSTLNLTLRNVINQEPFKPNANSISNLTILNLTGLFLNSDSLTTVFASTPLLHSTKLARVQIKEAEETWGAVFDVLAGIKTLNSVHFESLSYINFWFRVQERCITPRRVRRPLETSIVEDYHSLAQLRDILQCRREELKLKPNWFLTVLLADAEALTVSTEIEDSRVLMRWFNWLASRHDSFLSADDEDTNIVDETTEISWDLAG